MVRRMVSIKDEVTAPCWENGMSTTREVTYALVTVERMALPEIVGHAEVGERISHLARISNMHIQSVTLNVLSDDGRISELTVRCSNENGCLVCTDN